MLSLAGRGTRLCDGTTRREFLRLGGSSALGLALPQLLAAREQPARQGHRFGRAKSCIILWMTGGPSQHETWDPKPDAAAEVRGPFRPISTRIPGIWVCEHMPRTAGITDKLCVLRGVFTNNPGHAGGTYEMLTGTEHPGGKGNENIKVSRTDSPTLASVVKRFRPAIPGLPASVMLPQPVANVPEWPGQTAGFLGSEWDPWLLRCDPSAPNFQLPELTLPAEVPAQRLAGRRSLLDQVGRQLEREQPEAAVAGANRHTQHALDLLTGARVRRAFDLDREAPAVRDRYGRHKFGQGCLLARRMIEAGITLVQLNWFREPNQGNGWDVHTQLEADMKNELMPPMEYVPGREKEGMGRNHWGGVFSIALAGGGVRGGQVYGASDKHGAYPKDGAVTPADLTATIFSCLGIDPGSEVRDQLNRPHPISRGRVLEPLLG
jgi:hypothetical protein